MKSTKHQFYRKGTDNQKRADATMDLRRPDEKKVKNWSVSQKIICASWLNNCETVFKAYMKAFRKAIK